MVQETAHERLNRTLRLKKASMNRPAFVLIHSPRQVLLTLETSKIVPLTLIGPLKVNSKPEVDSGLILSNPGGSLDLFGLLLGPLGLTGALAI